MPIKSTGEIRQQKAILEEETYLVMDEDRAKSQDIRPLET